MHKPCPFKAAAAVYVVLMTAWWGAMQAVVQVSMAWPSEQLTASKDFDQALSPSNADDAAEAGTHCLDCYTARMSQTMQLGLRLCPAHDYDPES